MVRKAGSRKILQSGGDESSGSGIGVAIRIEFHGKVALIVMSGRERENFCDVDLDDCVCRCGDGVLYVRDGIGVREQSIEAVQSVLGGKSGKTVAEVWKCAQPRAICAVEQAGDEERVFTDRIIIFEMDDDISRGSVIGDRLQ